MGISDKFAQINSKAANTKKTLQRKVIIQNQGVKRTNLLLNKRGLGEIVLKKQGNVKGNKKTTGASKAASRNKVFKGGAKGNRKGKGFRGRREKEEKKKLSPEELDKEMADYWKKGGMDNNPITDKLNQDLADYHNAAKSK